jgi:hypothetical protein
MEKVVRQRTSPRGCLADPAHDLVATLWAYLAPKPRPGTCNTRDRIVECGMGDVVNLRRARKKAQRELAEREASGKRLLYGRSKAQRDLDCERDAKASRDLERHRIETGDER